MNEKQNQRTHPSGWHYHGLTLLFLTLAVVSGALAETWPVLVWVSPVFTLLYLDRVGRWIGLLLFVVTTVPVFLVLTQGVIPIPDEERIVMALIVGLLGFVPFLLQLLAQKHYSGLLLTLVFPMTSVTLEFIGSTGPFGTWGMLAYTQVGSLPLIQLASVTGIWGLCFIVCWTASTAWWFLTSREIFSNSILKTDGKIFATATRNRSRVEFIAWGIVIVLVVGYGLWRTRYSATLAVLPNGSFVAACIASPDGPTPVKEVRAWAIAYENSGSGEGVGQETREKLKQCQVAVRNHLEYLISESESAASKGAKLIVWSEAALFASPDLESVIVERGQSFCREYNVVLALTMAVYQLEPSGIYENKTVLINEGGKIESSYLKARIVPGEPSIQGDGDIAIVESESCGNLATIICFDADFPDFVRQINNKPNSGHCEVLIVSANDWREVEDSHLGLSVFRAIENGVWIVRATSNGKSAIISPLGEVVASHSSFGEGQPTLIAEVGTSSIETKYAALGDWLAQACGMGLLVMLVVALANSVRRKLSGDAETSSA